VSARPAVPAPAQQCLDGVADEGGARPGHLRVPGRASGQEPPHLLDQGLPVFGEGRQPVLGQHPRAETTVAGQRAVQHHRQPGRERLGTGAPAGLVDEHGRGGEQLGDVVAPAQADTTG
jgi:hypothetical protein